MGIHALKTRIAGFPNPLSPLIAFEDPCFVAVAKPAGIDTAPLASMEEECLLRWALERYPEILMLPGRKSCEPGLLHRLDRETSGLVLFARTKEVYEELARFQAEGKIVKEYLALCEFSPGGLSWARPELVCPKGIDREIWEGFLRPRGTESIQNCNAPCFGPSYVESRFKAFGPGRRRVAPLEIENQARVRYEGRGQVYRTDILCIEALGRDLVQAWLSLRLGFRHQIRAHLAWAGLPILGDPLYGKAGKPDAGMHLHAAALSFPHPGTGFPLRIVYPPKS